jgi:hypothetical protein
LGLKKQAVAPCRDSLAEQIEVEANFVKKVGGECVAEGVACSFAILLAGCCEQHAISALQPTAAHSPLTPQN